MKVERLPAPDGYYRDGVMQLRCLTCFAIHPCPLHSTTTKGFTMRFFDDDKVGCYLDGIDHRVEKTKDGNELRMVDLTLRVQPLTVELAASLDADVRALLFTMGDALPKAKLKAIHFRLPVPRQALTVFLLPEDDIGQILLPDVEITDPRARTEKGVDGFGLVFYASFGPVGTRELELICAWHTEQRFVSFHPQEPALDFAGKSEAGPEPARRTPRRNAKPPIAPGDTLRPGVHAEH